MSERGGAEPDLILLDRAALRLPKLQERLPTPERDQIGTYWAIAWSPCKKMDSSQTFDNQNLILPWLLLNIWQRGRFSRCARRSTMPAPPQ